MRESSLGFYYPNLCQIRKMYPQQDNNIAQNCLSKRINCLGTLVFGPALMDPSSISLIVDSVQNWSSEEMQEEGRTYER